MKRTFILRYSLSLLVILLTGMLMLSACGAVEDLNQADYNEVIEESENQATLEAIEMDDITEDAEIPEVEAEADVTEAEAVEAEAMPAAELEPEADPETQAPQLVRLTDILEYEVLSQEGDELGGITDFSIDTSTHRINYAIITFNGFLNLADETLAIPLDLLALNEPQQVIINVDREILETAPGFDTSSFTGLATEQTWTEEADEFWSSVEGHATMVEPIQSEGSMSDGFELLSVQALLEHELVNNQDESLGEIEDFIFDFNGGEVQYAVASTEAGILEIDADDELFAMPIRLLNFNPDSKLAQAAINADMVREADRFSIETWPDISRPEWPEEVETFWGNQEIEVMEEPDAGPLEDGEQAEDVFEDNELYDDSGIDREAVIDEETEEAPTEEPSN